MLAIGAGIMKTETELLLKSRYVVPSRLLQAGFTFDFPIWPKRPTTYAKSGVSSSTPIHES